MFAKLVTMKEQNASRSYPTYSEFTDPAAVKVLMDRNQVQLLRPFFEDETTISAAADALGVPLQFLFRKVERFVALGLLTVSREVPRKGRAVRLYRTPARLLYVPAAAVDLAALLRRSEYYWQQQLVDGLLSVWRDRSETGLGVQVHPNDIGGVRIALATEPGVVYRALGEDEEVMLNSWLRLRLTPEDARALQLEMEALVNRYTKKHVPGSSANFIARFALAPLDGS